jgi:hypothetical protein
MDKLSMEFALKLEADAADFVDAMLAAAGSYVPRDRGQWLAYCRRMKEKYPLRREQQPEDNEGKVNGFYFADRLSDYSTEEDVFVGSSSGRTCGISHMAYRLKRGQSFVTSMGLGSMGWCLPSAIACCVASGRRRTLLLEGDGSLQHNLQELQLISDLLHDVAVGNAVQILQRVGHFGGGMQVFPSLHEVLRGERMMVPPLVSIGGDAAAGFHGHDQGDAGGIEPAQELMGELVHELHIHPVIEKSVDLDDVPRQDPPFLAYPFLKRRVSLIRLCHALNPPMQKICFIMTVYRGNCKQKTFV